MFLRKGIPTVHEALARMLRRANLTKRQTACLAFVYHDGMTESLAARQLRVDRGTVHQQIVRGRAKLKQAGLALRPYQSRVNTPAFIHLNLDTVDPATLRGRW